MTINAEEYRRVVEVCNRTIKAVGEAKLGYWDIVMLLAGLAEWVNRDIRRIEDRPERPSEIVPRFTIRVTVEAV